MCSEYSNTYNVFHKTLTSFIDIKNNKNILQKMKENVGISKPKKHTNKIGMVP